MKQGERLKIETLTPTRPHDYASIINLQSSVIRVALVYPNVYPVGMANLGFQTVYALLNTVRNLTCERAFLPDIRNNSKHRSRQIRTVESGTVLSDFDIIAFSISFENDYLHLLSILKHAGLPLHSDERDSSHPLVIAGGVACFLNPEPISPFIDCFLLGEAEAILPRFLSCFSEVCPSDRDACLKHLARTVPGVYVPKFYRPVYYRDGTCGGTEPIINDVPSEIRRIFLQDLSTVPTYSAILTPDTPFGRTFLIETSRGCPHGCRFCSAGYIYRPPRFRPASLLRQCMETGMALTSRIGLVGAAVSDLPGLPDICAHTGESVRISFSSLRADALSPEIVSVLKQSHTKVATIAPDAGSQRMRDVINKGITGENVLNACELLVLHGILNLKLYFMIGLPTETADDIEAIVSLCKQIKRRFLEASRQQKRIGEITVSISPFVPKPFTPFQRAGMDTLKTLKAKIRHIKNGLRRVSNVRVHADIPRHAYVQALLSRGDRNVGKILELAHRYEGNWPQAIKAASSDTDAYVYEERGADERLPWEFIEHGIRREFLEREYDRAKQGKTSPDCPMTSCKQCGVCR